MRYMGCRGDAEVAPWFRWIAASLALLAMTGCEVVGGVGRNRWIAASLALLAMTKGGWNERGGSSRLWAYLTALSLRAH